MRWTKLASAGVVGLGLMCGSFEAMRPTAGPNRTPSPVSPIVLRPVPAPVADPGAQPVVVSDGASEVALMPVVAPKARPALPVEPIPGAEATWRTGVRSSDPEDRASAAEAIPFCPEHDGLAELERLMTSDPDAIVRERAVLAYTQAVGRKGVATLRRIALKDENEDVGSAARASLKLIDSVDPLPPRGTLTVSCDQAEFSAGDWLTVRARFQADQDVPEARFVLSLPKGWEVDPRGNEWKGQLLKGQVQEALFAVKAARDAKLAKLSGELKLDFAEELDVEVVSAALPLTLHGGVGRLLETASGHAAEARVLTLALSDEGDAEELR